MLHICIKDVIWRRIWKILQNFLKTKHGLVLFFKTWKEKETTVDHTADKTLWGPPPLLKEAQPSLSPPLYNKENKKKITVSLRAVRRSAYGLRRPREEIAPEIPITSSPPLSPSLPSPGPLIAAVRWDPIAFPSPSLSPLRVLCGRFDRSVSGFYWGFLIPPGV
jgi:hypothetical protein